MGESSTPHPRDGRSAVGTALATGLILVAVALAYARSLQGPLVFDDFATIRDNASIRQLWPPGAALNPPDEAGVGGRPVANYSFALSHALGGGPVEAHHAGNVLLHALAALALFGIVRRTLATAPLVERFGPSATPLAAAASTLWAVHPLATSAVNYVSQRTELLMALCYLLTLLAFIRAVEAGSRRWLFLAILACLAGMLSKETMVTAPFLLMLYDRVFLAGDWRGVWARRRWHAGLAASWLVLATVMATSDVGERGVGFNQGITPGQYLLTSAGALGRYLQLAVWPAPLVFDYGWDFAVVDASALFRGGAAALALGLTAWVAWRRPAFGFVAAAVLLILAPTTSVIPIVQQPIAESRMYLPLAAVVALLVLFSFQWLGPRVLIAWGVITAVSIVATDARHAAYRDTLSLWTDTVAKRPGNARAHGNLGLALSEAGREVEAQREFETALALRPDYPEARSNLAALLIRAGKPAEALPHLEAALRTRPDLADAHYNRGEALWLLNRRDEAAASYRATLRLRPNDVRAHNNLSVVLLASGRVNDALDQAQAALRRDPRFAPAHFNLANALAQSGRLPEAIAAYQAALRLDPAFAKAEHNLAVALLRTGDRAGAIQHLEGALQLRPDYPEARRNLELIRAGSP